MNITLILTFFKGEDLLRGVSADMYKVTVGEETCTVTDVTDTIILFKPPTDKPKYHTVVKVNFLKKIQSLPLKMLLLTFRLEFKFGKKCW